MNIFYHDMDMIYGSMDIWIYMHVCILYMCVYISQTVDVIYPKGNKNHLPAGDYLLTDRTLPVV